MVNPKSFSTEDICYVLGVVSVLLKDLCAGFLGLHSSSDGRSRNQERVDPQRGLVPISMDMNVPERY